MAPSVLHLIRSTLAISLFVLSGCSGSATLDVWEAENNYVDFSAQKLSVQFLDDRKSVIIMRTHGANDFVGTPGNSDLSFTYEIPASMPTDVQAVTRCEINEQIETDNTNSDPSGTGHLTLVFADGRRFAITSTRIGMIAHSPLEVTYDSPKIDFHRKTGYVAHNGRKRPLAAKIILTPPAVAIDVAVYSTVIAVDVATAPLWFPIYVWLSSSKRRIGK